MNAWREPIRNLIGIHVLIAVLFMTSMGMALVGRYIQSLLF